MKIEPGDLVELKPSEQIPYSMRARVIRLYKTVGSRFVTIEVECMSTARLRILDRDLILIGKNANA